MKKFLVYIFIVLAMSAGLVACGGSTSGNDSGGQTCEATSDCQEGQCLDGTCQTSSMSSCDTDLDCSSVEYCAQGQCLVGGCSEDTDCTGQNICAAGRCRSGCREDEQCPGSKICDGTTHVCRQPESCTTGSCPQFQTCDDQATPPECRPNGDCATDLDCTAYERDLNDGIDYTCQEGSCRERPPCTGDDTCAEGEICVDGDCLAGCRETSECLVGEYCDTAQLKCVQGCNSNADCLGDGTCIDHGQGVLQCETSCQDRQVCETGDGGMQGKVCKDQYCQYCSDDTDCYALEECNLDADGSPDGKGLCEPLPDDCPDDSLGNNHSQADAQEVTQFPYSLTDDDTTTDTDERPVVCKQHTAGEWFKLVADPGKIIEVEIEYDNSAGGNLELFLVDENGNDFFKSAKPPNVDGGVERVEYGVDPGRTDPLTAWVRVDAIISDPSARYTINIDVRDPQACTDDGFEGTNGNNTPADAATLPIISQQPELEHGGATGLQVCGDDVDWYTVDVPANHILEINTEAENRLGDVDIRLYDQDKGTNAPEETSQSTNDTEGLSLASDDGGTYLVEVILKRGVGKADYDIGYSITPNICIDSAEPNDTCGQATPVSDGTNYTGSDSLNICDDSDYYQVVLNPLDKLTVTVTYDPTQAAGQLSQVALFGRDLSEPNANRCTALREADGVGETTNSGKTKLSIVDYEAELGGPFYIQIDRFGGERVPYDMKVEVTPGPGCVDDAADTNGSSNDTSADAVVLEPAQVVNNGPDSALVGQKICDANQDWYTITIDDGKSLTWQIDQVVSDGEIGAALFDSDGSTPVTDSNGNNVTLGSNGQLSVTNSSGSSKQYYLRVQGKGGTPVRNDYWLLTSVDGSGPSDPACPDQYEDNDIDADAANLPAGSHGNLLLCSQDANGGDWYKTQVSAGEMITIQATFDHPDRSYPFMRLYQEDDLNQEIAQASSSGNTYTATYTSARDQFIFYRIDTSSSVHGDPYSLDVSIAPAPTCMDDGFEDNDTAGSAEPLDAPGLYGRLMKCDGEADWYSVHLNASESFEAYINYDSSAANLEVGIYDTPTSSSPTTGVQSAEITPSSTGTYYVRVAAADPTTAVRLNYDLLLYRDLNKDNSYGPDEGPQDRTCPDAYENNDTESGAASIPAGSYTDLRLCSGSPNDKDYYDVYVPAGATLTAEVSGFDSNVNPRVQLKEDGLLRDSSDEPAGAAETVEKTNNANVATTYTVYINPGQGRYETFYSMDVSLAFANACSDDSFAPNHDIAGADSNGVTSAGAYDLTLCEPDSNGDRRDDWFKVEVGAGDDLEANIELRNEFGNVDLELTDASGAAVASAATNSNVETLLYTNSSGSQQTLYLHAYAKGGSFIRTDYDLWLANGSSLPSTPFCPDGYERNDTTKVAAELDLSSKSQFSGMVACGAEVDWYQVELQGNTTYDVDAFFNHSASFDLDLAVRDSSGNAVGGVDFGTHSSDDDESVSVTIPSTGSYYVGVKNHGTAADAYYLSMASQNASCPEDSYEFNNNPGSATPIGPMQNGNPIELAAGACGDDDVYEWVPTTSGSVTVTVFLDNTDVNLGLEVREIDPNDSPPLPQTVGYDQGSPNPVDDNRVSATFSVTAGFTYKIAISRLTLPSGSQQSNGAYFLKVE